MDPNSISGPREGLQLVDVVGVAVYLLITAAIVVWSSRRQATTEDFFLGGRRMPWMAVGLSLLATLMSGISYVGVPGEVIRNGITMFGQYLAVPFSMVVVLVVWIPFFMRLRMTSAYEYLERRFDHRVRLVASIFFLLLRFGWISMVMYVGSLAISQMTVSLLPQNQADPLATWLFGNGNSILLTQSYMYWLIAFIGITSTVYACAGGFRAAIWNDVLQSIMLFGGTLVTIGYVMWSTDMGPYDWWRAVTEHSHAHTHPAWFSFDPTERMTILTAAIYGFSWTICTHGSDQVALQRYFSTESVGAARRSYVVNALVDLTIGSLLGLSGLALVAFYLKNPAFLPSEILHSDASALALDKIEGDRVLPHFFAHQLPAGIGGIILAVFLCDAMQTLVSGVNSLSAVFTKDLFRKTSSQGRPWLNELNLARFLSVVVGLIVTALGLVVAYETKRSGRNIFDMMSPAFNMFLGPLASLFLIGMFLSCKARTAMIAALCSVAISFVWSYWQELFKTDYRPSFTLSIVIPYASSFLIAAVISFLSKDGTDHPGVALMWKAVMRRNPETTIDPSGEPHGTEP